MRRHLICSDSLGQSPEPLQTFRQQDDAGHSVQDLVEAEAGPQAQVGPEVVEGAHKAEPVHGGHLHPDLLVEGQAEQGVANISLGSLLYCCLSYQTRRQTVGDENTFIEALLRK